MANKHLGSSFDEFLKAEENFEVSQNTAVKRVLAWQLAQAMKSRHITKQKLALLMKTSRGQVDRLLNPDNSKVQLDTLQRAANAVGCRLMISLEPAA